MINKSFTIYEVDDPQHLVNLSTKYFPEKRNSFVLIFEVKMVKETYMEIKKEFTHMKRGFLMENIDRFRNNKLKRKNVIVNR